jgi:outer membrane protein OmpA-like peptidoglycan-associated protein
MSRRFLWLLVLLSPAAAVAGDFSIAPSVTGESGLFTLFSGETLPKGTWAVSFGFENTDRVLDLSGVRDDVRGVDQSAVRLGIGYGITERVELTLGVPYWDLNVSDRLAGAKDASGLGNVRLGAKFSVLGDAGADRRLAIHAFVEPETGDQDVAGNDTGFGAGLNWSLRKWVAGLGYYDPGQDAARFHAAAGYVGQVSDRLEWITELAGSFYEDTFDDAFDLTTGGRLWLGAAQNVALNFGLRADLAQLSNFDQHCPIGGLLGLAFVPGGRGDFASRSRGRDSSAAAAPAPGAGGSTIGIRPEAARGTSAQPPGVAPSVPAPGAAGTPGAGTAASGAPTGTTAPGAAPSGAAAPGAATGKAPGSGVTPAPSAPAAQEEILHFTSGSARVSNIAKAKLDEVALKLKQDPTLVAEIIGHADRSGSAAANDRLSEQRAQAAKAYLVSRHGIDGARISTSGRGSSEATGVTQEDRRAVVIVRVE